MVGFVSCPTGNAAGRCSSCSQACKMRHVETEVFDRRLPTGIVSWQPGDGLPGVFKLGLCGSWYHGAADKFGSFSRCPKSLVKQPHTIAVIGSLLGCRKA